MTTRPLRLVVVNDYELIVRGVTAMLQPYQDRIVVVDQETEGTPDRAADIALFDTFGTEEQRLIARCRAMRDEGFVDHVVLYSWQPNRPLLTRAVMAGVDGVIAKSETAADTVALLEEVASGRRVGLEGVAPLELTAREQEILELMAVGRTNVEIARTLFVSEETVKTYAKRLFRKLGVRNRVEAAVRASALGMAG